MTMQNVLEGKSKKMQNVLVMQGGGSLGAYECGVYKALYKHGIQFDIIAGTSIGGVNVAIIVGNKSGNPAEELEKFWLDVAERFTPPHLSDEFRAWLSSMGTSFWGNPSILVPRWFNARFDNYLPFTWTHLYDLTPLKNTLVKYVDFSKLKKGASNIRTVITAVDVKTGEPVRFDNQLMNIDADHILASASYALYGIGWAHKDGRYLWDGSLLGNTPLRAVFKISPYTNKRVYIVDLFPHNAPLPRNMLEVLHRARDIIFSDKTAYDINICEAINEHIELLLDLYDVFEKVDLAKIEKEQVQRIKKKYKDLVERHGICAQYITHIERPEDFQYIFEDADFSLETIKKLIRLGEANTQKVLKGH